VLEVALLFVIAAPVDDVVGTTQAV